MLEADGLQLRSWRVADRDVVLAAYGDPDIQRWHTRSMSAAAEAEAWISEWAEAWKRETAAAWAITDGSQVLGRMGLRWMDLHEGVGEAGYWMLPEARGRRVASRALCVLTDWAFAAGFHRLELLHSVENPASCRVAGNAGYALEGVKRESALHVDGWHDMHLHARLAGDRRSAEDHAKL